MIYDLSIKEDRKKFIKRANDLLNAMRGRVVLADESTRTLEQNAYMHVLFRIVSDYTGDTVEYVKQVHFKMQANRELFVTTTKDNITKSMITYLRSTTELTVPEMSRAIDNFIKWAAEHGIELPEAERQDDGTMVFASQQDEDAFNQAERLLSED